MASTPYKHHAKPGDLIQIPRGMYAHWAIYVGNDEVVHFNSSKNAASSLVSCSSSGTDSDSSEGQVILQKIWDLVPFSSFKINNLLDDHYKPRERHIIVKEAREMVGWELTYNLTSFNCEHFVTLLRYGKPESQQVKTGTWIVGVVTLLGVIGVVALLARWCSSRKERNKN